MVYGIPQHATDLALPATTGAGAKYENPFRLWNSDVFEYTADGITSLYGSIPVMHAHSADSTVAVFNAVGSETWIDIARPTPKSTDTHWISESGILDIFIMPGPTPRDVFKQYAGLTGTTALPAHWALGYHQCRWNYVSSDDVRSVQRRFDEEDMPLDVIWLDIEYAPDHKYFIWKEKEFPDPVEMTNDVAAFGRKVSWIDVTAHICLIHAQMVVIIDPHLKRAQDYPVYKKASELEVLVKPPTGEGEYEGWCWSGNSAWVDFFDPRSWAWWKSLFKTKKTGDDWVWEQSTEDVFIWNDMNEVRNLLVAPVPLSESLPSAVGIQRPGDQYASRQRPLRRLGTPRRAQYQRHALCTCPRIFVVRIFILWVDEPDGARSHTAVGPTEAAIRAHPLFLCWLPALRRHVDRGQPRHLGAHGGWRQDGAGEQHRRFLVRWMCARPVSFIA